jgi:hypothetical protein
MGNKELKLNWINIGSFIYSANFADSRNDHMYRLTCDT